MQVKKASEIRRTLKTIGKLSEVVPESHSFPFVHSQLQAEQSQYAAKESKPRISSKTEESNLEKKRNSVNECSFTERERMFTPFPQLSFPQLWCT